MRQEIDSKDNDMKYFKEKLELINKLYFEEDNKNILNKDKIFSIEKKLNISIPEQLQEFYIMFGNKTDFLECLYSIISPENLEVKNDILTLAVENQGVCSYGLNVKNQKTVYFNDDYKEEIDLDIEDFILYLLAMQGTSFLECVVQTDILCLDILNKNFIKMSEIDGNYCVYCYTDKAIGFVSGNDIFLSAQGDEIVNDIEEKYGLQFDWC